MPVYLSLLSSFLLLNLVSPVILQPTDRSCHLSLFSPLWCCEQTKAAACCACCSRQSRRKTLSSSVSWAYRNLRVLDHHCVPSGCVCLSVVLSRSW